MNGRPPQSRRAGRQGAYAEAKYTNWMPFDPYEGEIATLPKRHRPSHILPLGEEEQCRIYERPLHPSFLRPYTSEDVFNTLGL